jgi:hypothetical protein
MFVTCAGLMACKHVAVLPVGRFLSQQDLETLVNFINLGERELVTSNENHLYWPTGA